MYEDTFGKALTDRQVFHILRTTVESTSYNVCVINSYYMEIKLGPGHVRTAVDPHG